jgi:hypothetical protein
LSRVVATLCPSIDQSHSSAALNEGGGDCPTCAATTDYRGPFLFDANASPRPAI